MLTKHLSDAEKYLDALRERLPEKTLRHTIAVTEFMVYIAEDAGITPRDAVLAGLLHDYCKNMDAHELLAAAERHGLTVTATQREKPRLLHGPVAAEEVREHFGITDEGVLDAIRCHTTGRPGLGPVGLALYFADFAEPLREHPEAAQAREVLERDGYRAALRFVSAKKLEHVLSKSIVDLTTREFDRWLQNEFA